jgi:hypothetical protein
MSGTPKPTTSGKKGSASPRRRTTEKAQRDPNDQRFHLSSAKTHRRITS